jgi:hypothetical protein
MSLQYILKEHETIPEDDVLVWGEWFEKANRVVKQTQVADGVEVSTVFLGLDHSFGSGKPLLFETMIFGGSKDGNCYRYTTWDEALGGHNNILKEFTIRCPYCGTLRRSDEVKCISCGGNF